MSRRLRMRRILAIKNEKAKKVTSVIIPEPIVEVEPVIIPEPIVEAIAIKPIKPTQKPVTKTLKPKSTKRTSSRTKK